MNAEERLVEAGIAHPRRAMRVIRESIASLGLDLRDLTVVTEAGTGSYALTPVIAAMAGAEHVRAITGNSAWGSTATIRDTVYAALELGNVEGSVELTEDRTSASFADADVVTNLGFVRPIDATVLSFLKPTAVVPLMCEAWEVRSGDVDLDASRVRGVLALGTNEHHPLCEVFRYSGPLAGKVLLEAGVELLDTRVVVVGSDRFGPVIAAWLRDAGAQVCEVSAGALERYDKLTEADVLLVAEYASEHTIVGDDAAFDVSRLAAIAPDLVVVQFAGAIEEGALRRAGLRYWPDTPVPARRMVRTFTALGPVPVIRLHAGGLKVGELTARARLDGLDIDAAEARAVATGLAQRVDAPAAAR
jgi:hypothetical protein